MKHYQLPIALLLLTSSATAHDGTWTTETFASPAGIKADLGAALILEVVEARGQAPSLRLFGGYPGNPAAIVFGTSQSVDSPVVLEGFGQKIEGVFDDLGTFSVSMSEVELEAGAGWIAQGIEFSQLSHFGQGRFEYSQGVSARAFVEPTFGASNLIPSFPEIEEVDASSIFFSDMMLINERELVDVLHRTLNSAGDALELMVGGEGSVGEGAFGGLAIEMTFSISRTEGDQFELAYNPESVGMIGVEATQDNEAFIPLGLQAEYVFRFHSIEGLAHVLAQVGGRPGVDIDTVALLQASEEAYLIALEVIEVAGERAQQLGEDLDGAAAFAAGATRDRVEQTGRRVAAARRKVAQARSRLGSARWGRPALRLVLKAAEWCLEVAKDGQRAALRGLQQAEQQVESSRQAIQDHSEQLAAAQQLVTQVAELGFQGAMLMAETSSHFRKLDNYTLHHYAAYSLGGLIKAEAEASVPTGIELPGLGLGASAEAACRYDVHVEIPQVNDGVFSVTVVSSLAGGAEAAAGLLVGANCEASLTFSRTDEYELWNNGSIEPLKDQRSSYELELDVAAGVMGVGPLAFVSGHAMGVGRSMSVALERQSFLSVTANVVTGEATLMDALVGMVQETELSASHRDHSYNGTVFGVGASYAGNGGAVEGHLLRFDHGSDVSWSITVGEIENWLIEGATSALQ